MNRREFHIRSLGALGAAAAWTLPASARAALAGPGGYPDKPVKLIVPYPAGGIVDVIVRTVTGPLSAELSQPIIVDNRSGADGRIGLNAAMQAPADGYTLLGASPLLAVGEHLM